MSNKNIIVAILSKSAAGKDTIARYLSSQGFKYVVSTTSRPMRSNETNHEDYHFVTYDEFVKKLNNHEFIEYRNYNTIQENKNVTWHYGIESNEIDLTKQSHVCVVDIVGLKDLEKHFGNKILSIYLDVDEKSRRTRAIARDRNFEEAEWIRRNADDDIKFEKIGDNATMVKNYNLDECIEEILLEIENYKTMGQFFEECYG